MQEGSFSDWKVIGHDGPWPTTASCAPEMGPDHSIPGPGPLLFLLFVSQILTDSPHLHPVGAGPARQAGLPGALSDAGSLLTLVPASPSLPAPLCVLSGPSQGGTSRPATMSPAEGWAVQSTAQQELLSQLGKKQTLGGDVGSGWRARRSRDLFHAVQWGPLGVMGQTWGAGRDLPQPVHAGDGGCILPHLTQVGAQPAGHPALLCIF